MECDEDKDYELFPAPFISGAFVLTAKDERHVKELLTGKPPPSTSSPPSEDGGNTTRTTATASGTTCYFLNFVHFQKDTYNYVCGMAEEGIGADVETPRPSFPQCTGDMEMQVFVPNDGVPKMFANVGRLLFTCPIAQRNRILRTGHFTLDEVKSKLVAVAFYPIDVLTKKMMMAATSPLVEVEERVRELCSIFSPKAKKHKFPIETEKSFSLHYVKEGGSLLNGEELLNNIDIWKKQLRKRAGHTLAFAQEEGNDTRFLEDDEVDHAFLHCMGRILKKKRLPPPQVFSLILNHTTKIPRSSSPFPFPPHGLTEEVAYSVVRQHETEMAVAKTFAEDVVQPICKVRQSMVNLAFYISEKTTKATMEMIDVISNNFTPHLLNGAAWWDDMVCVTRALALLKDRAFDNILNLDKLLEPVTKDAEVVFSESGDHFLELYGNALYNPLVKGAVKEDVQCEVVDFPRMEADDMPLFSQTLDRDEKWKTYQGKKENAADNEKRMKRMVNREKKRKRTIYEDDDDDEMGYKEDADEGSRKDDPYRDAHTSFPLRLYETKQKDRVRLSRPSQRVRFSSEHGYPMWAEPRVFKGEQMGYKFRQILPRIVADYINCVDRSEDDESERTTTMDRLLQTRAACMEGGRCNEVFMQGMYVSTFILDVDIKDAIGKMSRSKMKKLHIKTSQELCALIRKTAKKIFGAETVFFQENVYVYVSNREGDRPDPHATTNKRGYHVHCPLPPGVVMTFKSCRKFTKALECFRAGFVDGIGRPANFIFDDNIYPVKPHSFHHLRSPGQVKYNGTCKLELVEKADTYSKPIKWHERYTHGPQFREDGERVQYGTVIKNIKKIKDLRCASFFQTQERDVVTAALRDLSTSSCAQIRSFVDKHIVLDRPTEDTDPMMDMINQMWRSQTVSVEKAAYGKPRTVTNMSPCQKLITTMRENLKVAAGAAAPKKFHQHHLDAVENSLFVVAHGEVRMTVSSTGVDHHHVTKKRKRDYADACMPFCVRTPHSNNNVPTPVHVRIGKDMIRLLLYAGHCWKCDAAGRSMLLPNVTIPIQPVYASTHIEKMVKKLARTGLTTCDVYVYKRKKDEEMTEEEKADAACLEEARGTSDTSYNTIVGAKVRNDKGEWYSEHVENLQTLLFFSQSKGIFVGQTLSGFVFLALYNDRAIHAHAGGPKAALRLFQQVEEENVANLLTKEEWGLIAETNVVANSNY